MRVTRREFGSTVLAGVGGTAALAYSRPAAAQSHAAANRSLINGVQFGLQPFCYHDLPMIRENRGELIRRLVRNGMGMVELHATWVEPRFIGPGVTADAAREQLGYAVSCYLEAGPCPDPVPSTIVDCSGAVATVVREGALPYEKLVDVVHDLQPGR